MGSHSPQTLIRVGVTHFWLIPYVSVKSPFSVQNCFPSVTGSKWPEEVITEAAMTEVATVKLSNGETPLKGNLKLGLEGALDLAA